MLPFVSVVVVTKNNVKTIKKCIDNLLNQDYLKECYEIIFVDGYSEDGTDRIINNYAERYSWVKLYYEDYGRMGYARNLGVKNSRGDIIAFTDGDAFVPKDWIEKLVSAFNKDAELVAIGGLDRLVLSGDSSRIIDSWRRLKRAVGVKAIPLIKTVNFAIRRDSLINCGGFDPDLSHLDETELLARIYAKTKTNGIIYDPKIVVDHKRAQSIAFKRRIKNLFRKSVISTPVLVRRHLIRVAIANPSSSIATSLYLILACIFGTPLFFVSIMLGLFTNFLMFGVLLYLLVLGTYIAGIFLRYRKVVASIPVLLTVVIVTRLFGTFFGLIKWLFGVITTHDEKVHEMFHLKDTR